MIVWLVAQETEVPDYVEPEEPLGKGIVLTLLLPHPRCPWVDGTEAAGFPEVLCKTPEVPEFLFTGATPSRRW